MVLTRNPPAALMLLLALLPLLLTGCAVLDRPQDWGTSPEKLLSNGCPDLTGTYFNRATATYPPSALAPPLNEVLGPGGLSDLYERDRPWPTLPDATTATFTSDGDWLHVRFLNDKGNMASLKFKLKHWWGAAMEGADAMYHCQKLEDNTALGIDGARQPTFSLPYAFRATDVGQVFLSKDRDGSLVVNYRTVRASGVPQIGYYRFDWVGGVWWRYPADLSNR